jgi:transposase InsO family protein
MREAGLKARRRRKWAKTTDSQHRFAFADNILDRDFHAAAQGKNGYPT